MYREFGFERDEVEGLRYPTIKEKAVKGMNDIPSGDCVVIGDTPRDVYCSKPYGAFALAVATGPYSCRELYESGADAVFENLSDTQRFMAILQDRNNVLDEGKKISCPQS